MIDAMTILVVDDDQSERGYYRRVLGWAGYEVVTAADGLEALNLLHHRDFDLIVADIKMPHLDGYELYRLAREDVRLAQIPFLFVTAYAPGSDVRAYGERIGAGLHLTKPVTAQALITSVIRSQASAVEPTLGSSTRGALQVGANTRRLSGSREPN